jgi:hypothetical protein
MSETAWFNLKFLFRNSRFALFSSAAFRPKDRSREYEYESSLADVRTNLHTRIIQWRISEVILYWHNVLSPSFHCQTDNTPSNNVVICFIVLLHTVSSKTQCDLKKATTDLFHVSVASPSITVLSHLMPHNLITSCKLTKLSSQKRQKTTHVRFFAPVEITKFLHICALLGCCTAYSSNSSPKFRDNLSVPS